MKNIKYIVLSLIVIGFISCLNTEFDSIVPSNTGTADYSRYISVGNSLTQGVQDDGLHNEYQQQENSYPAIIARQMNVNFLQPLVSGSGSGYKSLQDLEPTIVNITHDANWIEVSYFSKVGWRDWDTTKKYNNLGVSGIRLTDCLPDNDDVTENSIKFNQIVTSFNSNGGFLNFGSQDEPITYLDQIKKSNATFFTCWLGNNDLLGWATEGGDDYKLEEVEILGLSGYLIELTDETIFRYKYDSILTAFTTMGAKGICATIPDVTSLPYFTTITLESINEDESVPLKVWITEGPYSNNPENVRLLTSEDLILITTKEGMIKPNGHGFVQNNPLSHYEVLDKDEVAIVNNHAILLNNAIKASAAAHNIPILDMNKKMLELKSGLTFDGVDFDNEYITGGSFSLDGIHPNSRGYAIIANFFIEAINTNYGSNLKPVAVNNYKGIIFP